MQLQLKILADLTMVATRDGVVDALYFNEGERVSLGSQLVTLLSGDPYASIYVPETLRSKMAIGSKFSLTIDGFEKPIIGTLRWVAKNPSFTPYYALSAEDRSRLMYQAEISLPKESYQKMLSSGIGLPVQAYLTNNSKQVQ